MKKKTVDLLTTIMAILLFIFALVAFWFDKMDSIMFIPVIIVSFALIILKNEKFEKLVYRILKIQK